MNNKILRWSHGCADDIANMTTQDDKVLCNYVRINQWAHGEQELQIEGRELGFKIRCYPEGGEVISLPKDEYKFSARAATSLLSSWIDELETFIDIRPQPRKFAGQTYPTVRIASATGTTLIPFNPRHTGTLRFLTSGNALIWNSILYRSCEAVGIGLGVMAEANIAAAGAAYEIASGLHTNSDLRPVPVVMAGIAYYISCVNAGAAEALNIDISIVPSG